jgi:ATP-dependent DNA helicase PIF1
MENNAKKRSANEVVDVLDVVSPNIPLNEAPMTKKKKLFGRSLESGKKVRVPEVVDLTSDGEGDREVVESREEKFRVDYGDQVIDLVKTRGKQHARSVAEDGNERTTVRQGIRVNYGDQVVEMSNGKRPWPGNQVKHGDRTVKMAGNAHTGKNDAQRTRFESNRRDYDNDHVAQRQERCRAPGLGPSPKRKLMLQYGQSSFAAADIISIDDDEPERGIRLSREAPRVLSQVTSKPHTEKSWPSEPPSYEVSQDPYLDYYTDPKKGYTKIPPPKPKKEEGKVKTEPELCAEQQALVNLILSGQNVFYTGSAGCGKSTVLKAFVKELKNRGKNVVIVAPTGKAALEVNGCTFYTFAGWTPDHFKKPIKDLRKASHGKFVRKKMKDVDVLVMDEISMVENHAFERLNEVMQEARGKSDAFGGVQLVVTGDFCQLPPVKPFTYCMECGRETQQKIRDTLYLCKNHGEFHEADKWAFRSLGWRQAQFQHVNLTTIHRQSDRKFIDILEKCRMGKVLTDKDTDLLLNHKSNVKHAVRLFSTRNEVRLVNTTEFNKLTSQKRGFKCHDNFSQQKHHPHLSWKSKRLDDGSLQCLKEHKFEPYIELKEGMLVVLQVNLNIEEGLVNGSQGVIVGWEPYDPIKMPKHVDREAKSSAPQPMNPMFGEYAMLREENVKTFIEQAEVKEWPIVKFDNGVQKTIFADCIINELGDEPPYSLLTRTQIPLLAGWVSSNFFLAHFLSYSHI